MLSSSSFFLSFLFKFRTCLLPAGKGQKYASEFTERKRWSRRFKHLHVMWCSINNKFIIVQLIAVAYSYPWPPPRLSINIYSIFIVRYGEGWNFGEVAENGRGINASQFNICGTGIGRYKFLLFVKT